MECKQKYKMDRDIKSIIVLLATQAMINLGEIKNPISQESQVNLDGAEVFMDLLEVLENKTEGNLEDEESVFLTDIRDNLEKVYKKKHDQMPI